MKLNNYNSNNYIKKIQIDNKLFLCQFKKIFIYIHLLQILNLYRNWNKEERKNSKNKQNFISDANTILVFR